MGEACREPERMWNEITALREEMVQAYAEHRRFTNPQVVRISQQLDRMLNRYDRVRSCRQRSGRNRSCCRD